jgi:hypothetical protein
VHLVGAGGASHMVDHRGKIALDVVIDVPVEAAPHPAARRGRRALLRAPAAAMPAQLHHPGVEPALAKEPRQADLLVEVHVEPVAQHAVAQHDRLAPRHQRLGPVPVQRQVPPVEGRGEMDLVGWRGEQVPWTNHPPGDGEQRDHRQHDGHGDGDGGNRRDGGNGDDGADEMSVAHAWRSRIILYCAPRCRSIGCRAGRVVQMGQLGRRRRHELEEVARCAGSDGFSVLLP